MVEQDASRPIADELAVTVKAPKQAARLLMVVMSVQALMGLSQFGLTSILTLSVASETLSWADLTIVEEASGHIVTASDLMQWPTAIVFLLWFALAASTNSGRGKQGRYGAGWAVGSFFIPIASLILPYRVMCEVFDNSSRQPDSARRFLVGGWWMTFLLTRVVGIVSRLMQGTPNFEETSDVVAWNSAILVESAVWTTAAVFALLLVREVNGRQTWKNHTSEFAEVFA